jgi:hypothetical protein
LRYAVVVFVHEYLRQPEVDQVQYPVLHHKIIGLDVSVNHELGVHV